MQIFFLCIYVLLKCFFYCFMYFQCGQCICICVCKLITIPIILIIHIFIYIVQKFIHTCMFSYIYIFIRTCFQKFNEVFLLFVCIFYNFEAGVNLYVCIYIFICTLNVFYSFPFIFSFSFIFFFND